LRGHRADVWGVAFAPSGPQLATAGVDHSVRIWNLPEAQVVALESPQHDVRGFAYSRGNQHLLTWTDSRAQLWDGESGELLRTLDEWNSPTRISLAPNGRHVATLRQGVLRLVRVDTGAVVRTRTVGATDFAGGLAFSRGGSVLRVSSKAKRWTLDGSTLEPLVTHTHERPIVLHADAPDDSAEVRSDSRSRLSLFDPRTGTEQGVLEIEGAPIRTVAFSPDGRFIVTRSEGHELAIWDAHRLTKVRTLPVPADATAPSFSPDGTHLATGSGTDGVRIWELATGNAVLHLEPEAQETGRAQVSYAPDGRRLAVSGSGFVRVHDAVTGQRLAYIDGILMRRVQFSPDGNQVTGLTQDHRLEVWDAETGEPRLRERVGLVRDDGSLAWPIPADELTRIGCTRLRNFARTYPEAAGICEPLLGG